MKVMLVRWNTQVDSNGALGRLLLMQYIAQTMRIIEARSRVASEWASYH